MESDIFAVVHFQDKKMVIETAFTSEEVAYKAVMERAEEVVVEQYRGEVIIGTGEKKVWLERNGNELESWVIDPVPLIDCDDEDVGDDIMFVVVIGNLFNGGIDRLIGPLTQTQARNYIEEPDQFISPTSVQIEKPEPGWSENADYQGGVMWVALRGGVQSVLRIRGPFDEQQARNYVKRFSCGDLHCLPLQAF